MVFYFFFFFFSSRRRHTRFSRDWSSDVCSSDLDRLIVLGVDPQVAGRLVVTYPRARVAGALRAAHRRHPPPRDLAAWVVAAIRQGWVAPTDSPWLLWRLHRLEGRMESWHTTTGPTPPRSATRPSCVSGPCGWCWRPWSRLASASG